MNSGTYRHFFRKLPVKILLLITYIITVNLLAGYIAVWLRFPTLWGGGQIFVEYALPIHMTWAFAHWPSLILTSISLSLLSNWDATQIKRFRIICLGSFLILLYGINEKVPFALFPAIDLITALFLSFIIVPPKYKENLILTTFMGLLLSAIVLFSIYVFYSKWQHQTPNIKEAELMDGLFNLEMIQVDQYDKELVFTLELTQHISQDNICTIASEMAGALFDQYRFDKKYNKIAEVIFKPVQENTISFYKLGEIAQYKENGEHHMACYLKYK